MTEAEKKQKFVAKANDGQKVYEVHTGAYVYFEALVLAEDELEARTIMDDEILPLELAQEEFGDYGETEVLSSKELKRIPKDETVFTMIDGQIEAIN